MIGVIALLAVARQLLANVLRFAIVALRPTGIVAAENLFLRRQLHVRRARSETAPSGSGDPPESYPLIQALRLACLLNRGAFRNTHPVASGGLSGYSGALSRAPWTTGNPRATCAS
jgi:hypothetical protein